MHLVTTSQSPKNLVLVRLHLRFERPIGSWSCFRGFKELLHQQKNALDLSQAGVQHDARRPKSMITFWELVPRRRQNESVQTGERVVEANDIDIDIRTD